MAGAEAGGGFEVVVGFFFAVEVEEAVEDETPIQQGGSAEEVRHTEAAGDAGVVEFVARCKSNGRAERMEETSRFVRQEGRWLYIDGDVG